MPLLETPALPADTFKYSPKRETDGDTVFLQKYRNIGSSRLTANFCHFSVINQLSIVTVNYRGQWNGVSGSTAH